MGTVIDKGKIELAWPDGPLRKIGSGRGKPSKYVCSQCMTQAQGVYHVNVGSSSAKVWVCASCRSEMTTKQPQPEGLRRHAQSRRDR